MVERLRVPQPSKESGADNVYGPVPTAEELPTMPAAPDLSAEAVRQKPQSIDRPVPSLQELPTMPLPAAEMPTLKMSEQPTVVQNDAEATTVIRPEAATEQMPERQQMQEAKRAQEAQQAEQAREAQDTEAMAEFFDAGQQMDREAEKEMAQAEAVESSWSQHFSAALSAVRETTNQMAAGIREILSTGYGEGTPREVRKAEKKSAVFLAAFGSAFIGGAMLDGKVPGPGDVMDAVQGSELSATSPVVDAMNQKNAELPRAPKAVLKKGINAPVDLGSARVVSPQSESAMSMSVDASAPVAGKWNIENPAIGGSDSLADDLVGNLETVQTRAAQKAAQAAELQQNKVDRKAAMQQAVTDAKLPGGAGAGLADAVMGDMAYAQQAGADLQAQREARLASKVKGRADRAAAVASAEAKLARQKVTGSMEVTNAAGMADGFMSDLENVRRGGVPQVDLPATAEKQDGIVDLDDEELDPTVKIAKR